MWLENELKARPKPIYNSDIDKLFDQAKQMEREQIEEFGIKCVIKDRKMLRQADCFNTAYLPKPQSIADYFTKTFQNGENS